MCPRSCVYLSALCVSLPMWPIKACRVLPLVLVRMNFIFLFLLRSVVELRLTIQHPVLQLNNCYFDKFITKSQ